MGEEEVMKRRCVVLLSGGLDSAVTAGIAREEGYGLYALTFLYGQKHGREIESARKIAEWLGVIEHRMINMDLKEISRSSLLHNGEDIPDARDDMGKGIPSTYVPARNIILLSYALSYAESIGAKAIFIGANAVDYSGYPDCRPEFFRALQEAFTMGTKTGIQGNPVVLIYPVIDLTKSEIISWGVELDVPLEHTWSCYRGGEKACGKCESCKLRLRGFAELGTKDPVEYRA